MAIYGYAPGPAADQDDGVQQAARRAAGCQITIQAAFNALTSAVEFINKRPSCKRLNRTQESRGTEERRRRPVCNEIKHRSQQATRFRHLLALISACEGKETLGHH